MLHAPLLQLPAHNPGQGAYRGLINIGDFKLCGIELISGPHAADDGRPRLLRCQHQRKLRRHRIHRIDHIVIILEMKFVLRLRQIKGLVYRYLAVRIDFQNPLPHHIRLVFSHGLPGGDQLPVQIGQADQIIVHQIDGTHTGAHQRLHGEAAHTADTEHDDPGLLQLFHGLLPQQQLGSGKLIQHASLSSVLMHGINDSEDMAIFQWYKIAPWYFLQQCSLSSSRSSIFITSPLHLIQRYILRRILCLSPTKKRSQVSLTPLLWTFFVGAEPGFISSW